MNYTTVGVINSAPQDMILSESHNLSRMVAAKNQSRIVSHPADDTTIITGRHDHDEQDHHRNNITNEMSKCSPSDLSKTNDHVDFDDQTDQTDQTEVSVSDKNSNINNNNYSVNNNDSNDLKITTKIQLNFSVDRLLGTNDHVGPAFDLSNRICPTEACRNNRSVGAYQCCKFANSIQNQLAYNFVSEFAQSTHPITSETAAMTDVKSIVRPTPIRAANRVNTVFPHPLTIGFHGSQTLVRYQPAVTNTLQGSLSSISQVKIVNTSLESSYRSNLTHTESNTNLTTGSTSGSPGTATSGSGGTGSTTSNKRKRSWSRAVFSNLQRKGLEIQFQVQKYITKPDRRKLAARLNLTDAQVKVWFQNRRMKWRHTRENLKSGQEKPLEDTTKITEDAATTSSEEDEIDVVAE